MDKEALVSTLISVAAMAHRYGDEGLRIRLERTIIIALDEIPDISEVVPSSPNKSSVKLLT